ncbi:MAG: glutamate formimidoyltransferase [Clostridia bacterium]|nr:glutamate formimidoyltransferase [Clostridia bacterium]
MAKIMECIPNFSEGRNEETLKLLAHAVTSTPGARLLNHSADANHNRSVYTLAGSPESVLEAVFKLAKTAVTHIDLTRHSGEHPRMGAVDVIPFVPLAGMEMSECVELSKALAVRLWNELALPVFLYEESASSPERRNLAVLRRGQFEGMARKIERPEFKPDYGDKLHPTAGIVACGARMPLVAFNINLSTDDIRVAEAIAKVVRESGGGLSCVKAIGIMLEDRNTAQVSLNMTNHIKTPLYRVLEFVRFEAARYGVSVIGTELIGMAPMRALVDCAHYYLGIENFNAEEQVLEHFMLFPNNDPNEASASR